MDPERRGAPHDAIRRLFMLGLRMRRDGRLRGPELGQYEGHLGLARPELQGRLELVPTAH